MKHAYYKMFLRNMKNQNVSFWMSRTQLVSEDFGVLEYLNLCKNQIVSIEHFAFQHLTKLKWVSLWDNKIH
jgi:hypothetical protein